MNNLHINIPKVLTDKFRILPKRCSKFTEEFDKVGEAIYHGMHNYPQGFRVSGN